MLGRNRNTFRVDNLGWGSSTPGREASGLNPRQRKGYHYPGGRDIVGLTTVCRTDCLVVRIRWVHESRCWAEEVSAFGDLLHQILRSRRDLGRVIDVVSTAFTRGGGTLTNAEIIFDRGFCNLESCCGNSGEVIPASRNRIHQGRGQTKKIQRPWFTKATSASSQGVCLHSAPAETESKSGLREAEGREAAKWQLTTSQVN